MSLSVPCSLAVSRNPCTASAMFRRASASVSPQLDTSSSGTCAMKVPSSLRMRTVNPRSMQSVPQVFRFDGNALAVAVDHHGETISLVAEHGLADALLERLID